VFVYHHVIGDGMSGLIFHKTMLQALNTCGKRDDYISHDKLKSAEFSDSDESNLIVTSAIKPVLPAVEEILSLPTTTIAALRKTLGPWIPSWLRWKLSGKRWSGNPYRCDMPIETRIRAINIGSSATQALVRRCRIERTTVTPFLQVVVGKVLLDVFKDAKRLRCAVAVSLRRFFPTSLRIGDSAMGLWVDGFCIDYRRSELQGKEGELIAWDTARMRRRHIEHQIVKRDTDLELADFKHIKDFREYLMGMMGKKRVNSYSITNIGVFNGRPASGDDNGDAWVISDVVFSQSIHVNGSAIQFCIVSTKDGGMSITLNWQNGIISAEDGGRIAESLRQMLEQLGEE